MVGTQSRFLIEGLLKTGKYSFRCFGGAVKHGNYDTVVVNEDFVIKPVDGFSNPEMIRMALATEKPDAMILFTDPRFFIWLLKMEDEIHQICPILWNCIWDSEPTPAYNRWIYDSVDQLNCISHLTYDLISQLQPKEKVDFTPHALPENLFFPLKDTEKKKWKKQLLGEDRKDHFIGLWVSRNARRKRTGDLLWGWSEFVKKLEKTEGHKNATLILHADPLDQEGLNVYELMEHFKITNNVFISKEKLAFEQVNILHNVADFGINVSHSEGWGLPITESLQAGTPVIAPKTGGLTYQVVNKETGEEHGIAMNVDLKTLVGSQDIPYIYENYSSIETISNSIMKMYEIGNKKRQELGQKGREYVLKNFSYDMLIKKWDKSLEKTIKNWKKTYKNWEKVEL